MTLSREQLDLLESVLARRARSRAQARSAVSKVEALRDRTAGELGEASPAVAVIDHFLLLWAHRNAAWLTGEQYERIFRRVEAREPLGRARRLFNLSALSGVARFVRLLRQHPGGVTDVHSRHHKLRPLVEIEMAEVLPVGITRCGIQARDRLIVHVGSTVYDGALAILSTEAPPPAPGKLGERIVFVARILDSHCDHDGSSNAVELRLSDVEPKTVKLTRGVAGVECVIFNRPDILTDLPEN